MTANAPPPSEVKAAFPQLETLTHHSEKGGFKWVYRAVINGRPEAFMVVPLPALGDDEAGQAFRAELIARVRREVNALAKCRVPELVELGMVPLTSCVLGGAQCLAYSEEFVEGRDLAELIGLGGTLPAEDELRQLFASLLRAIAALWSGGYVHRDIKPANVIKSCDSTRPFILLDLGIAYCINDTSLTYGASQRLPPATYRYLAPEMAQPGFRETLDYRSDLYSTALTVYEYAAGRHPFARGSDDVLQTISRAVRAPAPPLLVFRPDLSPSFCELVDQMLRKKPALRPANIARTLATLEDAV